MESLSLIIGFALCYVFLNLLLERGLQYGERYAEKKYKEAGIPFNREKVRRRLMFYIYRGQRIPPHKLLKVHY